MLAIGIAAALAAVTSGTRGCAPEQGLQVICGPAASEDLVLVPGTRWLIASGLNVGAPAHFSIVDTRTKRSRPLRWIIRPDPRVGGGCDGPPDRSRISTDGLGILPARDGRHLLYAANHGDRRAIEIFRLDSNAAVPRLYWAGCVPMPDGTMPNAVAPLRDGGFAATSFYDPRDSDYWTHMGLGEPTGGLWIWHPQAGFRRIGAGIAGANGLALSDDERTLYVSAWSTGQLFVVDPASGRRSSFPLGFLPDNIKRAKDGSLLVTGQRTGVSKIAACTGATCPQPWIVARVDPARRTVRPLVSRSGSATISYACSALVVDRTMYITARSDRRIAYLPTDSLPSLR